METGQVKHLILIFSGINVIDLSAPDTLENQVAEVKAIDINVHCAEFKSRLTGKIKDSNFIKMSVKKTFLLSSATQ